MGNNFKVRFYRKDRSNVLTQSLSYCIGSEIRLNARTFINLWLSLRTLPSLLADSLYPSRVVSIASRQRRVPHIHHSPFVRT